MAKLHRPLYLMTRPTEPTLGQVFALPRTSEERPPYLSHITLLPFFDLVDEERHGLGEVVELMSRFWAYAFHVRFDRICEHRAVTLRPSKTLRDARAFQRSLVAFLRESGFARFGKPPDPHLTISYHRDGQGEEAIAPIGWRVDEVVLIESVHGQATHIEHGRWQLRPLLV
jgi:2'-5' RNA ligase